MYHAVYRRGLGAAARGEAARALRSVVGRLGQDRVRRELAREPHARVMCFSGRGGEVPGADGTWRVVTRDEIKRRFRAGEADLLLCTDAAAEGLNFQFCGALVNVDMPWNPMRVEQRIGRIDRLGQSFQVVRIVNLHYADTVEADVYATLRDRIDLFGKFVGKLQPILAALPKLIEKQAVGGRDRSSLEDDRTALLREINRGGRGLRSRPTGCRWNRRHTAA